ncbi:MAG: hypothetical protein WA705_31340 [Candidatus Ozemobacteraceae bacterium]
MSDLKTCFKRVDYDLNGPLHYGLAESRKLMACIIQKGYMTLV